MKKIFLIAYDQCNLGDDLFVRTLARRYSEARFYMRGNRAVAAVFEAEKNIKVVPEDTRLRRIAWKIRPSLAARMKEYREKRCDALVYIGGSLFIEYQNWETLLTWWRYAAENRKFFVLGANFGPWHTEEYRRQFGEIFMKMQDVCFRDKYSKELFSEVPTVRYAPDILLGYPMPEVEVDPKQAFVSVINCESKDEGDNQLKPFDLSYTEGMADLVQRLLDQGWKVVLSSFCRAEGDEEGVRKIIDKLADTSSVEVKNYDGFNTDEILRSIAASAIVYGTRFHAAVLGFAAWRPVVPIIYSDKTKNILEDMSFSGKTFDIRKFDDKTGLRMAEAALYLDRQSLSETDRYAKQSEDHFLVLDRFLK